MQGIRKMGKRRFCIQTGKVAFKTHEAALMRGGKLIGKPGIYTNEFRAYRCNDCGFWHLTCQKAHGPFNPHDQNESQA